MISKFARKKFLKRKLDSFEWMKSLRYTALLQMIAELRPQPEFDSPFRAWKHQLVAFLIGVYVPKFLFFLDMGTGKSRIILDLLAYQKQCGNSKAALIMVPNVVAIENWIIQFETHESSLKYVPLFGSSKQRRKLLLRTTDVFILNYDGLVALCTKSKYKKTQKGERNPLVVDPQKIQSISKIIGALVLDESTAIMNSRSLTYRVCYQISKSVDTCYPMTGTPFGRDPTPLWSQFYVADNGETLGPTLGLFREAFFKKSNNYWGGFEYKFKKKLKKKLRRVIQNRSIHYSEKECADLPKKVPVPIYVSFTEEMKSYYARVLEQLRAAEGDLSMQKNSFIHMRQISSGFMGLTDDETGEKIQLEFPDNPKMEALRSKLMEIPPQRKFLIYHEYIWTGNRISKELEDMGIRHERLWSGEKDKRGALRRFLNHSGTRGFVINNKSGAFALDLPIANYEFFVESPTSPILRAQAEKRIHRGTQKRKCFIIDLIMKNSVDERILSFIKEGKDLMKAVVGSEESFDE